MKTFRNIIAALVILVCLSGCIFLDPFVNLASVVIPNAIEIASENSDREVMPQKPEDLNASN